MPPINEPPSAPLIPPQSATPSAVSAGKGKMPWIIGGTIVVLLLVAGGYVFAQNMLFKTGVQIPEIQSQQGEFGVTQATPTSQDDSPASCLSLSVDLQFESGKPLPSHPDVAVLSKFYAEYYDISPDLLSGRQNGSAAMSVFTKRFQKEQSLTETGVVDQQTRTALEAECISMRQKKRDLQRLVDLRNIRDVLLGHGYAYENFPASPEAALPKNPSQYAKIKSIPLDPLDNTPYLYRVIENGRGFELKSNLEQTMYVTENQETFKKVLAPDVSVSTVSCSGAEKGRYCYSFSLKLDPNY